MYSPGRSLAALIALPVFLAALATPVDNATAQTQQIVQTLIAPVVMPIEVHGASGHIETVSVTVDDASSVNRLWIKAHNLSYDDKGSVKVNDGAWIDLRNANVDMAEPEIHFDGIGGSYSTIRFSVTLPSGLVKAGSNTIQFRFNGTDGVSSGWRVLAFNFLRSSGAEVLSASAFVEDDPSTWQPILTSGADLAAGADLWKNAALTEPISGSIKARCADCHAEDGRDLKYFNYSNQSIVARAEFHGLTQKQGEQIASWIRSLPFPSPGRPWNPPYQPGPGTDAKPVEEWSAGAGLEWVMEDDRETIPYLFPNGITNARLSSKTTLNLREIPISVQLPDWNHWLPIVHPKDYWSTFTSHDAWKEYDTGLDELMAGGVESAVASKKVIGFFESWDNSVSDFRRNEPWPAGATPAKQVRAHLSLHLWQIVKVWEIMQKYHLEDRAPDLYPAGEKYTWFSRARNIFNVAPHISREAQDPNTFTYGTEKQDKIFSHLWYHAQMIINAGNRDPLEHSPVDWKYQFGHISDFSNFTNVTSGTRMVATYAKLLQMTDNEDGIGGEGWYMRHVHPYWFVDGLAAEQGINITWSTFTTEEIRQISEKLLRSFTVKNLEFPISAWGRGEENDQLEPATYKPEGWNGNGSMLKDRFNYADNFYRIVPFMYEMGVAPSLIDSLAQWGKSAWPLGDWDSLYEYDPNDDHQGTPVVSIVLDVNNPIAREPGGAGNKAKVFIKRTGDLATRISVGFQLSGTAINGTDYAQLGTSVILEAGVSQIAVVVDPVNDLLNEGDETVTITLSAGTGYDLDTVANKLTLSLKDDDNAVAYSKGDVTGDGSISALDAALVLQHVASVSSLTGPGLGAADVSGDSNVSAYDASLILQYVTGLLPCFPASDGCSISKR
ncbi:MAG: dockerin type I domain-containing protein [Rhodothermales bacterium]